MKKTIIVVIVAAITVTLMACSSSKLADIYSEEAVVSRAKKVVELINTLDYDAINSELRSDLQDKLTADSLMKSWNSILTKAGVFEKYKTITTAGQKSKSTGEDYATVILVCAYENNSLTFTIVMDKDLEIVGMYLK